MCFDGTPIVYSQYLPPLERDWDDQERMSFRILVEPGGVGITVAEQVDVALSSADRVIQCLNWRHAIDDLNGVVARVFPRDASVLRHWWGGIWLGLAASPKHLQFRLYMNLRYGSAQARWQRFADVLGFLGDESLGEPLQRLVSMVSPLAIPVGIGVVLSNNRVAGLRLYTGVHDPKYETLRSLLPDIDGLNGQLVASLYEDFRALAGEFKPQSVTVGYDFHLDSRGIIKPQIARSKLDISCQFLPQEREPALLAMVSCLAKKWRLNTDLLELFVSDLSESFGGYRIEYVSFSLTGETPGITIYAKPDGYALS